MQKTFGRNRKKTQTLKNKTTKTKKKRPIKKVRECRLSKCDRVYVPGNAAHISDRLGIDVEQLFHRLSLSPSLLVVDVPPCGLTESSLRKRAAVFLAVIISQIGNCSEGSRLSVWSGQLTNQFALLLAALRISLCPCWRCLLD